MRYLKGICTLVLVLGICLPAQATVQNVRVGGDIQIRAIARDDWGLGRIPAMPVDNESWYDSTVRLQLEAELAADVGAVIRLINERDWTGVDVAADDIELDLAYLTMDHMFGFPLRATLGRQEILFGEGFLIGDGYNIPGVEVIAYGKSVRRAFDALRLTYDVFPYTVDLFTAKIDDGGVDPDWDLHGLNISFNHLDIATFDLGYFVANRAMDVETRALSLRGEGEILIQGAPGLTVKGEKVWQSGDTATPGVDLDASGWYLGAEYALPDALYEPYFSVTFIFMSGNEAGTGDYEGFDPLFEDKAWGTFAEVGTQRLRTNAKIWRLAAGLRPTEVLSLGLSYYIGEEDETVAGVSDELGDELNLNLTWDYTEDVQFGLSAAWFDPGDALVGFGDDTATQIVGSVKVSF